ncbi:MAG: phosphate acyltransferase, partial [Bdellovibrionota bacterium]
GPEYIIPKPFDPRVLIWVAPAVAQAAIDEGVARREFPGLSVEGYRSRLEKLLNRSHSVMHDIKDRIRSAQTSAKKRDVRIVLPEGNNERILKAAAIMVEERIARPILLGDPKIIPEMLEELNLFSLRNVEIIRPSRDEKYESYSHQLWELRKRKGLTPDLAAQHMKDPMYFGSMLVRKGRADAFLAGVTRTYPETIRPALHVVGSKAGQKVAGIYMLVHQQDVYFIADTTVNIDPSAEDLAEIAINAAHVAQSLGFDPRIAMLSFSNFGSNVHPEAQKMSNAARIVQRRRPDLVVDGEMQADTAISTEIMQDRYPFCRLRDKGANVLICPNLSAANIAYKLMGQLGNVELIGPILTGMNKPMHVLQTNASVPEIVNMAIIAVMDVQRQGLDEVPVGQEWTATVDERTI